MYITVYGLFLMHQLINNMCASEPTHYDHYSQLVYRELPTFTWNLVKCIAQEILDDTLEVSVLQMIQGGLQI